MPEQIAATSFSKYFSFLELTDSKKHPTLVPQNRKDAMVYINAGKRLSKLLETIKLKVFASATIITSSGYRNEVLNHAVGSRQDGKDGRKLSNHCKFEAVDIIPQGYTLKQSFDMIMSAYKKGLLPDLRKCIIEDVGGKEWLHIEVSMSYGDFKGFLTTADGINYTRVA
jgi:hypothetical protein